MIRRMAIVVATAAVVLFVGCGGSDSASQGDSGTVTQAPTGGAVSKTERIHARYLISEFERDKAAADKRFGGKFVTFESFVDKQGSNDNGPFVRVKSEPFATRFIYCYYEPAQADAMAALESGSVAFLNGRIGDYEDVFLTVTECSVVDAQLAGGGTKGGS